MAPLLGLRVLVVDDQRHMRFMVTYLLETNGAKVKSCESADRAINTFIKWKPDVIISDITMPEHDGYWLMEHIRQFQSGQYRETPAIALTSMTNDEDRVRSFSAGFQIHMAKPIVIDDLIRAVRTLTHY
jgi:two-component system, OmpR family, response regulator